MKNFHTYQLNLARQQRTVGRRANGALTLTGKYSGRDNRTGARRLTTADGGVRYARYISNSQPDDYPALLLPSRVAGLVGNVDQKPS